ncbi:hypothetical protein KAH55_10765, partial [bacterium]|nr:hypothetical protein [bacterium]
IGGFLGYLLGFLFGIVGTPFLHVCDYFEILTVIIALGMATLLAVLASWLPAVNAISQDPADILKDE